MIRELFESAGLGHFDWRKLTAVLIFVLLGLGLTAMKATGLLALGIAVVVVGGLAIIEAMLLLATTRTNAIVSALPEVIESIAAGIQSGEELADSLCVLATAGPGRLRPSFAEFARMTEQGQPIERNLNWLQRELASVYSDQLVQLLLLSLRTGGNGLVASLQLQATNLRTQATLEQELSAKQGWVAGTAKLGLVAPWLIVLFLNTRKEANDFYSSSAGVLLLLLGLVVCLFAYILITSTARLPKPRRVFSQID